MSEASSGLATTLAPANPLPDVISVVPSKSSKISVVEVTTKEVPATADTSSKYNVKSNELFQSAFVVFVPALSPFQFGKKLIFLYSPLATAKPSKLASKVKVSVCQPLPPVYDWAAAPAAAPLAPSSTFAIIVKVWSDFTETVTVLLVAKSI